MNRGTRNSIKDLQERHRRDVIEEMRREHAKQVKTPPAIYAKSVIDFTKSKELELAGGSSYTATLDAGYHVRISLLDICCIDTFTY